MTRQIILCFFLVFSANLASAQDYEIVELSAGVKCLMDLARLDPSSFENSVHNTYSFKQPEILPADCYRGQVQVGNVTHQFIVFNKKGWKWDTLLWTVENQSSSVTWQDVSRLSKFDPESSMNGDYSFEFNHPYLAGRVMLNKDENSILTLFTAEDLDHQARIEKAFAIEDKIDNVVQNVRYQAQMGELPTMGTEEEMNSLLKLFAELKQTELDRYGVKVQQLKLDSRSYRREENKTAQYILQRLGL